MFILKRLGLMVLTMVVSSFLVFSVNEFTPGSVASKTLGPYASDAQKLILFERLQLDDPFFFRYFRWLGVLTGVIEDPLGDPALNLHFTDPRGHQYFANFGYSTLYKAPVNDIIWKRLANTLALAGIAFAIIVPLSMLFGILSGMSEGSVLDRTLSYTGITLTSIPEFASGVMLMAIFVVWLGWLPGTSPLLELPEWSVAEQFVLPVLILVLYDFGYVARMVRGSMVEVMTRPYIRTAVLKGLPYRRVILKHGLRNAMIAPFTVILLQINFLITGVVVTEVVTGFPGFGRMLLDAALFGDITLVEAATMVAVLIAVSTQLVGDVGYMYLNPRIRFT
ncbi:MAG: ABC transporter permease [Alphaproteobacteria bacterium]